MKNNHRVVLVTGASSGIGKCCAEYFSQQGYRVYGTSRRTDATDSEQRTSNTNLFQMFKMDVTDGSSVKKGIDDIIKAIGLFRSLGMRLWQPQAEAILSEVT